MPSWCVLLLVSSIAGCSPWSSCFDPSSAEGAERIRAIPPAELHRLYGHMQLEYDSLPPGGGIDWVVQRRAGGRPLPEYFAGLGAVHGSVGWSSRLVFGGCMDDKAVLFFEGLDREGPRRIRFLPGEREPEVVLWEGRPISRDRGR